MSNGPTFRYLELPADDVARALKFYNDVLGWVFLPPPPEAALEGDDTVYLEGPAPELGISSRIRPASGGAGLRPSVLVDSIEETLAAVEKAGGATVAGRTDYGDGWGGVFADSEGNHIFLWEFKE